MLKEMFQELSGLRIWEKIVTLTLALVVGALFVWTHDDKKNRTIENMRDLIQKIEFRDSESVSQANKWFLRNKKEAGVLEIFISEDSSRGFRLKPLQSKEGVYAAMEVKVGGSKGLYIVEFQDQKPFALAFVEERDGGFKILSLDLFFRTYSDNLRDGFFMRQETLLIGALWGKIEMSGAGDRAEHATRFEKNLELQDDKKAIEDLESEKWIFFKKQSVTGTRKSGALLIPEPLAFDYPHCSLHLFNYMEQM